MEEEKSKDPGGTTAIVALGVALGATGVAIIGAPPKVAWSVAFVGYFVAGVSVMCANEHGIWRSWSKLGCVAVSMWLGMMSGQAMLASLLFRPRHDPKYTCIANLKQIDGAMQQFALENKLEGDAPVKTTQIVTYLKGSTMPICPSGGTYKITRINERPTCTIDGHRLE